MIAFYIFLLHVLVFNGSNQQSGGYGDISIITFNIRFDNPNDGDNRWGARKHELVDLIRAHNPDIFGIQEGLHHQVEFLDDELADYQYLGVGRDDGIKRGEYSAIFYHTDRVQLIDQNTFWLSPYPDRVSVGWDASMERICTFGLFKIKESRDTLLVYNAHFDHIGKVARLESARTILHHIEDYNQSQFPIVVMGDFNCLPDSDPIQMFKTYLRDPLDYQGVNLKGPIGTYNGFDIGAELSDRIDYILVKNLIVTEYMHIADRRDNDLWPSDHLPISARIDFIHQHD